MQSYSKEESHLPCISIKSSGRVLLVLRTLWGENGITTHLLSLSDLLIQNGWQVGLVTSLASGIEGANGEASRALEKFKDLGVKCFILPLPNLSPSTTSILSGAISFYKLSRIMRKFKPDLLHLHSFTICPYAWLIRRLYGTPYVSTCHVETDSSRPDIKLSQSISKYLNNFYGNSVIAISSELCSSFENILKISPTKIRKIYHGIDELKFHPPSIDQKKIARQKFNLTNEDNIVCHVGRLAHTKGHDILIKSVASLYRKGVIVHVLCAGKGYGDEVDSIRKYAEEQGVSHLIHLLGVTDPLEVLWASDAIVLPSRPLTEAFPLVIPEAMLCGVIPLRTPASGAVDQISHGKDGFIFPFEDHSSLAGYLEKIFDNTELKTSMSKAALLRAKKDFTLGKMATSTISLYSDYLARKSGRNRFSRKFLKFSTS
jgi:glycosyltransferase involved in cell wall biosynthesis